MVDTSPVPRLFSVVVTYRRPEILRETVRQLYEQTRVPDHLVVVDNDPSPELERWTATLGSASYLPMEANIGPAGGLAAGLRQVLATAQDDDAVLLIDDDDPPPDSSVVQRHISLLEEGGAAGVVGVGLVGARYSPRTGRLIRVRDEELRSAVGVGPGVVDVDYLGGNQYGTYRIAAIRSAGPLDESLFFGFEELEFGLRLRAGGGRLIVDAEALLGLRQVRGRLGIGARSAAAGLPAWRRYYSSRNIVRIARDHGRPATRWRVAATAGPLAATRSLLAHRDPRAAGMALKGVVDGLRGVSGCTVDPVAKSRLE